MWNQKKWIMATIGLFVGGCTLGPPPPLPPGLFPSLFNLFLLGVVIWMIFFGFKGISPDRNNEIKHFTDALNEISERLDILEEKVEQIRNKKNGKEEKR